MPAHIVHTIPPVYDARSRVLILGTMPSPKSREQGFYYGHPQNRFWRALAAALDAPAPQTVPEKRALALRRGIALWDVLASCDIEGASDASIQNPVANDLTPILAAADIRAVFTTGRRAAGLYQTHIRPRTGLSALALPSPSPANCACSFERLVEAYRAVLDYLED